jgi:hypothetical protein
MHGPFMRENRERAPGGVRIDGERRNACIDDDNVFDAMICALTARAAQLGFCHPVPPEHGDAARVEGWIALPKAGTLEKLAGPSHA